MSGSAIKSGPEVISEFLASKKGDKAIDAQTLATVQELFDSKKLTKTQLLRSLEKSLFDSMMKTNIV
jgi:hypothetical protein